MEHILYFFHHLQDFIKFLLDILDQALRAFVQGFFEGL